MKSHHWIMILVCVLTLLATTGIGMVDRAEAREFWMASAVLMAGTFLLLEPGAAHAWGAGACLYLMAFLTSPSPGILMFLCTVHLGAVAFIKILRGRRLHIKYIEDDADQESRDRMRAAGAGAASKLSGSMQSMIDKETGEIRLSADCRICPATTRDEFLGSALAGSCKVLKKTDSDCSWRVPEHASPGGDICAALYFEGQQLSQIDLSLGGLEGGPPPDDWSQEREFQKKLEHDELLGKWMPGERSLEWGSVCSTYDQKASASVILIQYQQETADEPQDSADSEEDPDN
jgi:hypothetical protein